MNCISVQYFDCSQMKLLFCIRFLLVVLLDLLGLSFFSPIMVNFTVMGGGGVMRYITISSGYNEKYPNPTSFFFDQSDGLFL